MTLEDFDHCDALFCIGHNPGTNHPRMLTTLREVSKQGVPINVFNPLRERGLERFTSPQHPVEMLMLGSTPIASTYYLVKVGGDIAVLNGIMKTVLALDAKSLAEGGPGVLDRDFITNHTTGIDELLVDLDATSWDAIEEASGLSRSDIESVGNVCAKAERVIINYGMGITQHRHGTGNAQQIANLLLLRGNIGRKGAGMINEVVLPFIWPAFLIWLAFLMNCRIDRCITDEASVHVNDILFRDIKTFRDQSYLIWAQVAAIEDRDLVFRRAQFEEKLLLVCGSSDFHKGPRSQNVILYRSPDPPHRISGKAKTSFGIKAVQCLQQADVALGDDFRNGHTIAAVADGGSDGETQMTCDKLVRGITVTALAPTFGELVLMVLFEHLETVDVVQITRIDAIPDGRQWIPGSRCEAYEFSLNAHISTSGVENCMPVAARRLERFTE